MAIEIVGLPMKHSDFTNITREKHHFYGKIHYFDWAIFHSKLSVYQRVNELVGGLEFEFYDFPYVGNNNSNWLSYFSEGLKPPTSEGFQTWWYPQIIQIRLIRQTCAYVE